MLEIWTCAYIWTCVLFNPASFSWQTLCLWRALAAANRPTRRTPRTCLMSSSLDTKRAALHDISNKGGLPGGDKVREPRAASAMGRQLEYQPCASTSPGGACQIVSQPLADACVSIVWQGSGALLSSAAPLPPNVRIARLPRVGRRARRHRYRGHKHCVALPYKRQHCFPRSGVAFDLLVIPLVMGLGPRRQVTEGEIGKCEGCYVPGSERVPAPLDELAEVIGSGNVLERATCM